MLPAIPEPSALDVATVGALGAELLTWAESTDDVAAVRDAANRWAAITEYVRRTSREGVAEAEAALRRLEVRVGQLNERPGQGSRTSAHAQKLEPSRAREFAEMADHADVVEDVIAESTDADPPSRRKVLTRIRERKQAAETATARAEDRQWAADLRERAGSDPAEDRRRQQIRMDVRAAIDAIDHLGSERAGAGPSTGFPSNPCGRLERAG